MTIQMTVAMTTFESFTTVASGEEKAQALLSSI
jgi:hypothetical protein